MRKYDELLLRKIDDCKLLLTNTVKSNSESRYLAEKIYNNTLIKYKAGTASSITLTQTQTQYFQALSAYYQSLNDLIDRHIKLKKIMNLL